MAQSEGATWHPRFIQCWMGQKFCSPACFEPPTSMVANELTSQANQMGDGVIC
jgi:hypothetical protein